MTTYAPGWRPGLLIDDRYTVEAAARLIADYLGEDAEVGAVSLMRLLAMATGLSLHECEGTAAQLLEEIAATLPFCRRCGCTEESACAAGCCWVAPDLCSECE